MEDRWNRLEEWFEENIPSYPSHLRPPATEQEVADAEAELGVTFPPSVRKSYLIHDGEERGHYGGVLKHRMLQLTEVVEETQRMRELFEDDNEEWDHSMIPLFEIGDGDLIYVTDAPDGAETPVRYREHTGLDPYMDLAPSFPAYVDTILETLEAGDYDLYDGFSSLDPHAFPYPWTDAVK